MRGSEPQWMHFKINFIEEMTCSLFRLGSNLYFSKITFFPIHFNKDNSKQNYVWYNNTGGY